MIKQTTKNPTHKKPEYNLARENEDLKVIRQNLLNIDDAIGTEERCLIRNEVLESINNFSACTCFNSVPEKIDQIRGALFLLVNKIKEDFINRTTLLAKQENEFFKFTITLVHSNRSSKNSNVEYKNFLEGIYWSKRNAKVDDGKIVNYYYTRLPSFQSKDETKKVYTKRSFSNQGASKWQIEECLKCEKNLTVIRNILYRISEIKRHLFWCGSFTDTLVKKLQTEIKDNQEMLTANINKEKTDEEIIADKRKQEKFDFYNIRSFDDLFAYQKKYGTSNVEENKVEGEESEFEERD